MQYKYKICFFCSDETLEGYDFVGNDTTSGKSSSLEPALFQDPRGDTEPMFRNITTSIKRVLLVEPTSLRRNRYYYQIYYVYLNTIFASLLPLALLLYFNINTAKELFKMSRLEIRSFATTRASSVTLQSRRRSTLIDLNPNTATDTATAEMRAALQIAAESHGLNEENSSNGQLPAIKLSSEDTNPETQNVKVSRGGIEEEKSIGSLVKKHV